MPTPVIKRAPPGSPSFTLPGAPVPKPRQTQSDKWNKRPEVIRYRAYADLLRNAVPLDWLAPLSDTGIILSATFYVPMPASWPKWKRCLLLGQPLLGKPDLGNLMKSVEDAIWPADDSMIFGYGLCREYWEDEQGARSIIAVEFVKLELPLLTRAGRRLAQNSPKPTV